MSKAFILLMLIALILAFVLGAVLRGRTYSSPSPEYLTRAEQLRLENQARLNTIKTVFLVALGVVILVGVTGITLGLVRMVWLKARLVYPARSGIFPVLVNRVGPQVILHDPNRTLAGTTVLGRGPDGVSVQHLLPPEAGVEAQLQVTTQAQVAQAVAAAAGGDGVNAQSRKLIESVTARQVAAPLPEVEVSDLEPSHVERLLLETGEDPYLLGGEGYEDQD